MDENAPEASNTRPSWWANTRGEYWVAGQIVCMSATVLAPLLPFPVSLPAIARPAGICLMAAGVALGAWGMRALGTSLAAVPKPVSRGQLVTSGPYALVRHPIYASVTLVGLGWALTTRSLPALTAALATTVYLDRKAAREEAWLREKYADYAAYAARVKRLVPFVW